MEYNMKTRRTDITKKIVDEMVKSGMTHNQIAKHFGVSRQLIGTTARGERYGRPKNNVKSNKKCICGNNLHPGNRFLCRTCWQGGKNFFDEDFLECT